MDTSVIINEYCINCALKFNNASQMFTNMRVGAQDNCSGSWEIEILDAIFYIYGFSARELAISHLDNEYEDDSIDFKDNLLATTNYINENKISLCSSCVSVFKKVYTDHVQFTKLSKKDSLLRKAIKRFSPSKNVKLEVNSEENGSLDNEDTENLDTDFPNAPNIQVDTDTDRQEALVRPCFVNICAPNVQDFNFDCEEIDSSDQDSDEDVKPDPLGGEIPENVLAEEGMKKTSDVERLSVPPKLSGMKRKAGKLELSFNSEYQSVVTMPLAEGRVTRRRTYSLLPPADKKNIKTAEFKQPGEKNIKRLKRVKPSASAPQPQCISEEQRREMMRLRMRKINKYRNRNWKKSKIRSREKRELAKRKSAISQEHINSRGDNPNEGSTLLKAEMDEDTLSQYSGVPVVLLEKLPITPEEQKNIKITEFKLTDEEKIEQLESITAHSHTTCISEEQRQESRLRMQKKKIDKKREEWKRLDWSRKDWSRNGSTYNRKKKFASKKSKAKEFPAYKNSTTFTDEEKAKWFACSCGQRFQIFQTLRKHEKNNEHLYESLPCAVCGQAFNKMYLWIQHKFLEHSDAHENLPVCSVCGRKFLHRQHAKMHEERCRNLKENSKSTVCEKCGKPYVCLNDLRKHVYTVHRDDGLDKELFKCPQCGIRLKHSNSLKKHQKRMHGEQKTFICEQCGKTTKNMTNMRIHMKVHDESRAGSRPYKLQKDVATKKNDTNLEASAVSEILFANI